MLTRSIGGRHDLLALAAAFPKRYPCLLESVAHGPAHARWDLLLAFPQSEVTLDADGRTHADGVPVAGTFLDRLDQAWRSERTAGSDDELPFHGGWALYLGYELIAGIESRLQLPPNRDGTPTAMALRCPAAIVYDHARDRTVLVAEAGRADLLDHMQVDLDASHPPIAALPAITEVAEDPPQQYLRAVEQVHAYLLAGDIFQANISRQWRTRFADTPSPHALYAALRDANPAPFAALWQHGDWSVVSSSPERLVQVRGSLVQTRPIAGTRPRIAGDDEAARIRELVAHPKERAEHVMLIDLERNDLGRVCQPGSVQVDELMHVESYAHVHHIVSNVRGRLRDDVTPGQVIGATFPGGTITGCPKVRCMQIIAELEDTGRGAYTGAIGYLDRNGDMDLNILIRTLVAQAREVTLRAGAGIVIDSDPQHELDETRAKARGLLQALGVAS